MSEVNDEGRGVKRPLSRSIKPIPSRKAANSGAHKSSGQNQPDAEQPAHVEDAAVVREPQSDHGIKKRPAPAKVITTQALPKLPADNGLSSEREGQLSAANPQLRRGSNRTGNQASNNRATADLTAKQHSAKRPAKSSTLKRAIVRKPVAKKSAPKQPAPKQPVAKQPAPKHPAAKQPAPKQPAAKQPAVKKLTTGSAVDSNSNIEELLLGYLADHKHSDQ